MIKMSLIAVVGVLLILLMKSVKSEYGIYVAIGISLILLFGMSSKLENVLDTIWSVMEAIQLDKKYVKIILKMLGIVYVAEFSSAICKDAGYQTIASQIEVFGKLTLLVQGMPILEALLLTIQELFI